MIKDIKSAGDLEEVINQLEKNKEAQQAELSVNFRNKMDSLNPINIIKSSVTDFNSNTPLSKKIILFAATTLGVIVLSKILKLRFSGGLRMMIASAALSKIIKGVIKDKSRNSV